MKAPGRRSFLHGLLATGLLPLTGCGLRARPAANPAGRVYTWSGIGFGIEMSMELHDVSEADGRRMGRRCEEIIAEHEAAFSLYRQDSELSRLNRERTLSGSSPLFQQLLELAGLMEQETLGHYRAGIHGAWLWSQSRAFDWPDADAPEWQRLCEASSRQYWKSDPDRSVALTHPLTRLSMNAIGQGFLADCVAAHLRGQGVGCALLHLGESVAIGRHPAGRAWRLAVAGTEKDSELLGNLELIDSGLAVSVAEPSRPLIDPVSGEVCRHHRVCAVVSRRGAAVADAHATAFAVAPMDHWPEMAGRLFEGAGGQVKIWQEGRLQFELGKG